MNWTAFVSNAIVFVAVGYLVSNYEKTRARFALWGGAIFLLASIGGSLSMGEKLPGSLPLLLGFAFVTLTGALAGNLIATALHLSLDEKLAKTPLPKLAVKHEVAGATRSQMPSAARKAVAGHAYNPVLNLPNIAVNKLTSEQLNEFKLRGQLEGAHYIEFADGVLVKT
jgi:hypothetical protein